ncbi:MAG: hypothetical protein JWN03_4022 [Nocardia sp.]|uniref:hypothetical protein n=1 Tax=Nocardia sp. TaxID=1821 RepID=UPI00262A0610|nr:hypothetical protein [Nocardia sp.]MCU1643747.1 hypothetical protein [Nocardia sp.]
MTYSADRLNAIARDAQRIAEGDYASEEANRLRIRFAEELRKLSDYDYSGPLGLELMDFLVATLQIINTASRRSGADPSRPLHTGPRRFALNPEDLRTIEPRRPYGDRHYRDR